MCYNVIHQTCCFLLVSLRPIHWIAEPTSRAYTNQRRNRTNLPGTAHYLQSDKPSFFQGLQQGGITATTNIAVLALFAC